MLARFVARLRACKALGCIRILPRCPGSGLGLGYGIDAASTRRDGAVVGPRQAFLFNVWTFLSPLNLGRVSLQMGSVLVCARTSLDLLNPRHIFHTFPKNSLVGCIEVDRHSESKPFHSHHGKLFRRGYYGVRLQRWGGRPTGVAQRPATKLSVRVVRVTDQPNRSCASSCLPPSTTGVESSDSSLVVTPAARPRPQILPHSTPFTSM